MNSFKYIATIFTNILLTFLLEGDLFYEEFSYSREHAKNFRHGLFVYRRGLFSIIHDDVPMVSSPLDSFQLIIEYYVAISLQSVCEQEPSLGSFQVVFKHFNRNHRYIVFR